MLQTVGASGADTFSGVWLGWVALLPLTWGPGIWVIVDASNRPEWAF